MGSEAPFSADRLRLFGVRVPPRRCEDLITDRSKPNGGSKLSTTPATNHFLDQPSKRSKRTDIDPPVLFTCQVAYCGSVAMTAWPLEKIEPECEKVVDDATSFPKSMCGLFSLYPLFRKGTHPGLVWLSAPYEGSHTRRRDHEKITRHLESECI